MRQAVGIPMGDPHSPGMTIITCAWMEKEWMAGIDDGTKRYFRAKRYMDDILLVYAENRSWDHARFLTDWVRSECYMPPLSLEDAKEGTFLETTFEITAANTIRRWLKNEAKTGESWKYAHYNSHSSRTQKRAVLVACLRKIHLMANDVGGLYFSAIRKLKEFENLEYPVGMLRNACNRLGATTGEGAWIGIRNRL